MDRELIPILCMRARHLTQLQRPPAKPFMLLRRYQLHHRQRRRLQVPNGYLKCPQPYRFRSPQVHSLRQRRRPLCRVGSRRLRPSGGVHRVHIPRNP